MGSQAACLVRWARAFQVAVLSTALFDDGPPLRHGPAGRATYPPALRGLRIGAHFSVAAPCFGVSLFPKRSEKRLPAPLEGRSTTAPQWPS